MNHDDESDERHAKAPSVGNVGFVVDGIDLRSVTPDDIQIVFDDDENVDGLLNFDNASHRDDQPEDFEASQYRLSDSRGSIKSKLPPLWPEDLMPPNIHSGGKPSSADLDSESSTYQHRLMKEYKARAAQGRFRITGNGSMYFPQMSFSSGVKYSGTVTLSQISMIIVLGARNEALRVQSKQIGCEHLLIGLIENHGFAAGQLLLGLHLNGIGRPWALGDLLAQAKRSLKTHSKDIGKSVAERHAKGPGKWSDSVDESRDPTRTVRGAALDMGFTTEAEQVLIESMQVAAQAGYPQVSTKHILTALLRAGDPVVTAMLRELSISESEVRDALKACPEIDDSREFVGYFLSSIVHSIIRFRLFRGPARKYAPYSTKKTKPGKKKKT
ncbi:MAG: Clp protease N-terminal domain-containing protein [Candidatus Melainabacteria bacterium]|nr:Clp protease N-terminal domain-containing protein [Candidatus Melainabacteria bacterium]